MKIIAATANRGKLAEIERIFSGLGFTVMSLKDAGIESAPEENGKSFMENALIKARAAAEFTDGYVIADDSGLCVDALDGAPGIYSARYAGKGASDADKINKLLHELSDKDNRAAHFETAVAMILPDGMELTAAGRVDGHILDSPEGENGFGYDPVFFCDEIGKSFAAATAEEKNAVSHRGRALMALYEKLKTINIEKERKMKMDIYNDSFIEYLIKKKKGAREYVITALLAVGGVIVTIGLLLVTLFLYGTGHGNEIVSFLTFILIVLAWYGVYLVTTMQNVEYEYILTNSEMDIDKVMSKKGRKHVVEWDFKNIDVCARVDDVNHKYEYENAPQKVYDLTGDKTRGSIYFVDYPGENGTKIRVLFQPTAKMINTAAKYNRSRIFVMD